VTEQDFEAGYGEGEEGGERGFPRSDNEENSVERSDGPRKWVTGTIEDLPGAEPCMRAGGTESSVPRRGRDDRTRPGRPYQHHQGA